MVVELKRSHCEKIVLIDGKETTQPKKPFPTLDAAIEAAKKINAYPNITEKVVAYKCKVCHKYHVGRNGKILTSKYKNKLITAIENEEIKKKIAKVKAISFKILGKVDLSKLPPTKNRFKKG